MICAICGGSVIWKGPITALTHTECQNCGAINCQMVETDPDEDTMSTEPENTPTADKPLIDRLKAAIEGECDGLAITDQHAKAILSYVLGDDDLSSLLIAAQEENSRLRAALTDIAAYHDTGASEILAKTGSYTSFDEPCSVRRARAALEGLAKGRAE